jgi:hypothetical protein
MSFQFEENDFFVHFWFAEDIKGDNFLMFLRKTTECWKIDYRFRYKRDAKIFDSGDIKSFYEVKVELAVPEEKLMAGCREMGNAIFTHCIRRFDKAIDGNLDTLTKILKQYPDIFHMQVMEKNDGHDS